MNLPIPIVRHLPHLLGFPKLDVAYLFSMALLVFAAFATDCLIRDFLFKEDPEEDSQIINQREHQIFIRLFGYPMLFADIGLFFAGVHQTSSWERQGSVFSAFLLTAAYVSILAFWTYVNLRLSFSIRKGA